MHSQQALGRGPHGAAAAAGHGRWRRRLAAVGLAALAMYTVAAFANRSLVASWQSAEARVLIEAVGFCIAIFAALTLAIPTGEAVERSRNAFIAALAALAASHALMIVGFILIVPSSQPAAVSGLYGWLTARYLAGAMFLVALVGWPRFRIRNGLVFEAVTLVAAVVLCSFLADVLPSPLIRTVDGLAVLTFTPLEHLLVSVVPAGLFAIGAVLAWRVSRRQPEPIYGWLALALAIQTMSKAHEVLYTASFGPVISTSDVLRVAMLLCLMAGVLVTVRGLAHDRVAAVEGQQRDLAALEQMYDGLARFAEKEQTFRSVVVHELATPVAALRAFAHVLTGPGHAIDPGPAREGIVDASRRLQELIDRMEDLRDIDHDDFSVELRSVAMAPVIRDAATFLQVVPGNHRVAVQCEDVRAYADPVRLGQALRNLVTNAARYSPPDSPIIMSCHADGDTVRVTVTDAGPGIPASDRDRLMSKYERGERSSSTSGAGLGLYIAHHIATAHGGRLLLEDGPDGIGTSATIELRGSS